MANEPTSPRTQQGDNEEPGTPSSDSRPPKRPPQHQQVDSDSSRPKPIFRDWAAF
ncbi:MAG: hypothetical protein V4606_04140 [Patescibacteria group bacterium]